MKTKILVVLLFTALAAGQSTQIVAQAKNAASNSVELARPAVALTVGTWKYKETDVAPGDTQHGPLVSTFSVTIKDEGQVWAVSTAEQFPEGPVTDVSTLEKGTLILRKEAFTHFLHPDQRWKPVAINLDFTGNKLTGAMKYVSGPDKPVAMDLGGPVFAEPFSWIGCLPLAEGYSTSFRYFDIDRLPIKPQASIKLVQLKMLGMERVTVPAGTFDSYKLELASADGGSSKETVWIAKDSRIVVKISGVDELYGVTTTELVP